MRMTDEALAELYPLGSSVTTDVHGIGGRCERVTGDVVSYQRGTVVVSTAAHGRICVERSKVIDTGIDAT